MATRLFASHHSKILCSQFDSLYESPPVFSISNLPQKPSIHHTFLSLMHRSQRVLVRITTHPRIPLLSQYYFVLLRLVEIFPQWWCTSNKRWLTPPSSRSQKEPSRAEEQTNSALSCSALPRKATMLLRDDRRGSRSAERALLSRFRMPCFDPHRNSSYR